MIVVNARTITSNLTGSQRYLIEIQSRISSKVTCIKPSRALRGLTGHIWEQAIPLQLKRNAVLWSPSNTGPLYYSRQVLTLHDVVPLDHPEWLNKKFALWYRWLTPQLVKKCIKIITVSNYSKERILNHIHVNPDKIHVVHNGVDSRFNNLKNFEDDIFLSSLKLPSKKYILSVCSIEPRKNLKRLLESWALAQSKISSDIWLVLAGGRGASNIFKDVGLQSMPPRVFFTGRVDDVVLPALYRNAIGFVYLSMYEGFGLPPLEAMSSGVPVLVSNTTAMPEVVGNAGLLVDPFSVEEIVSGLISLSNDDHLRANLVIDGLEQSKKFNWDMCAEKTYSILENAERD